MIVELSRALFVVNIRRLILAASILVAALPELPCQDNH
jgi:hypothetical protein